MKWHLSSEWWQWQMFLCCWIECICFNLEYVPKKADGISIESYPQQDMRLSWTFQSENNVLMPMPCSIVPTCSAWTQKHGLRRDQRNGPQMGKRTSGLYNIWSTGNWASLRFSASSQQAHALCCVHTIWSYVKLHNMNVMYMLRFVKFYMSNLKNIRGKCKAYVIIHESSWVSNMLNLLTIHHLLGRGGSPTIVAETGRCDCYLTE